MFDYHFDHCISVHRVINDRVHFSAFKTRSEELNKTQPRVVVLQKTVFLGDNCSPKCYPTQLLFAGRKAANAFYYNICFQNVGTFNATISCYQETKPLTKSTETTTYGYHRCRKSQFFRIRDCRRVCEYLQTHPRMRILRSFITIWM